jgi:hypothetical protein
MAGISCHESTPGAGRGEVVRKRKKYLIFPVGWHPHTSEETYTEAKHLAVLRTKPPKELRRLYEIVDADYVHKAASNLDGGKG